MAHAGKRLTTKAPRHEEKEFHHLVFLVSLVVDKRLIFATQPHAGNFEKTY